MRHLIVNLSAPFWSKRSVTNFIKFVGLLVLTCSLHAQAPEVKRIEVIFTGGHEPIRAITEGRTC